MFAKMLVLLDSYPKFVEMHLLLLLKHLGFVVLSIRFVWGQPKVSMLTPKQISLLRLDFLLDS
jgi:hypothetical protein